MKETNLRKWLVVSMAVFIAMCVVTIEMVKMWY